MAYNIDLSIKPYDDDKLIYDKRLHRYRLADNAVGNDIYVNNRIKMMRLNSQALSLYSWIYNHNPYNKYLVEYILAHNEECRNMIYDALMECFIADTTTNYGAGKYQYGNVDIQRYADDRALQEKLIPISARIVIQNNLIGSTYLLTPRFLYTPKYMTENDRYERFEY